MLGKMRKSTIAILTGATLAVGLSACGAGVLATSNTNHGANAVVPPSIHQTDCGNRTDFLKVYYHYGDSSDYQQMCFANAGIADLPGSPWVTGISSGNNHVLYYADGRWQPDNEANIPPNSTYTFPRVGAARIEKVRILP